MRNLSHSSTCDQQLGSNPRPFDLESIALSTWAPVITLIKIIKYEANILTLLYIPFGIFYFTKSFLMSIFNWKTGHNRDLRDAISNLGTAHSIDVHALGLH